MTLEVFVVLVVHLRHLTPCAHEGVHNRRCAEEQVHLTTRNRVVSVGGTVTLFEGVVRSISKVVAGVHVEAVDVGYEAHSGCNAIADNAFELRVVLDANKVRQRVQDELDRRVNDSNHCLIRHVGLLQSVAGEGKVSQFDHTTVTATDTVSDTVDCFSRVGSNASLRCSHRGGFEVFHDRTFLFGNETAHQFVGVVDVLFGFLRHVGSRRQVLVDGEGELTSVKRTIGDCSIFCIVVNLCLTNRRNVEGVPVGEALKHTHVALCHHFVAQNFLKLGGPNVAASKESRVGSSHSHCRFLLLGSKLIPKT